MFCHFMFIFALQQCSLVFEQTFGVWAKFEISYHLPFVHVTWGPRDNEKPAKNISFFLDLVSWLLFLPFSSRIGFRKWRNVAPGHLFKFLAGQNLSLSLVHCLLHGLQLPQLLQPRLLSACRRKKQYLKNTYCCTLKGVKFGKSVGQYWFESLCHNWLTVRSLPLTRRNKDSTIWTQFKYKYFNWTELIYF